MAPLYSRFKATYSAESGFSGIGVPEDLFGFCSHPPTNMYYVNVFAPVAGNRAGIGPGRRTRTIVRDRGSGELPGVITQQLVTKQVLKLQQAHITLRLVTERVYITQR